MNPLTPESRNGRINVGDRKPGTEILEVIEPSTGNTPRTVADASAAHVGRAAACESHAWPAARARMRPDEGAAILRRASRPFQITGEQGHHLSRSQPADDTVQIVTAPERPAPEWPLTAQPPDGIISNLMSPLRILSERRDRPPGARRHSPPMTWPPLSSVGVDDLGPGGATANIPEIQ